MDSSEPSAVSQTQPAAAPREGGDPPTLRDLSARSLAGDHGAFEQIHRRVGAGLRRLLLRRSAGREDLVEDLCQKTWTSVWKAISEGKYDPERSAITTFVYAVGNNAWLTHLRTFARDQGYVAGAPAMLGADHMEHAPHLGSPAPDDAHTQAETIECVRAMLRDGGPGGMTDAERIVVRAIAAGESDRALARRLNLSSSTVNIRKHAGYAKIREYLRAKGLVADDFLLDSEQNPERKRGTSPPGHRSAPAPRPEKSAGPSTPRPISGGGAAGGIQPALAADHAGRLP